MPAYYNEHDPFAAAWLRELIRDDLIAPGEVDERSIEDVTPDDIRSFQQCHFFAGIGVWSFAARLVGIPDDAPLWSGSCPCQPFSAAGKGGGFDDERHLWPAFHYLIEQCRPPLVVGEQVAGADGDAWLDLVSADLDATGYAFGAAETVAAGFGAPHKRTRNYWVAHANDKRAGYSVSIPRSKTGQGSEHNGGRGLFKRVADRIGAGLEGFARDGGDGDEPGRVGAVEAGSVAEGGELGRLADAEHHDGRTDEPGRGSDRRAAYGWNSGAGGLALSHGRGRQQFEGNGPASVQPQAHGAAGIVKQSSDNGSGIRGIDRPGPVNGFWRDADWLRCRDEKWRPVEPGTFPLADAGAFRNRVGLLRGAGNAITLGQATGFLQAVMETIR